MRSLAALLALLLVPALASAAPDPAKVREAYERGRDYFIEHNARPSFKQLSTGGYVKLKSSKTGQERTLGPNVYIEYQLYDLTLFLFFHDQLGFAADDPLVREGFDWLYGKFDRKSGSWPLWSVEGCLHTKGTQLLQRFGKPEEAKAALAWNLRSPLYARPGFIEGESGHLIQSWGSPSGSLTGQNFFIYGKVTAEMTLLNLFTFSDLGYRASDPLVRENTAWIRKWLASEAWRKDEFDGLMGLSKLPELVERYGLDPKLLDTSVRVLSPKLARPLERKSKLEKDVYFLGEALRGLISARRLGTRVPEGVIEGAVEQLLSMQSPDGHWTMTIIERGRERGLFISDLNGTSTLSATLALRAWLDEQEKTARPDAGSPAGSAAPAASGAPAEHAVPPGAGAKKSEP